MATIKYVSLDGLSRFYSNLKTNHFDSLNSSLSTITDGLDATTNKANNVYNAFQAFLGGTWSSTPAPTLVQIKNSLDALAGEDTAIKAYTINGKTISSNPVLTASDIKLSATVGDLTTASSIQAAIENLNSRIGTVESAAGVSKLIGGDGSYVKISAGNGGVGEVTLSVDDSAIKTALDGKANNATTLAGYGIADAYTKTETDNAITAAFNDFATKVSDDNVVNTYKELIDYAADHGAEFTELVGVVAGKADKATTLAGYGITDAYTKTEVNTELAKKVNVADIVAATNDEIDALFA